MAPKTTIGPKAKTAKKLSVELTEKRRVRRDNQAYYSRIDDALRRNGDEKNNIRKMLSAFTAARGVITMARPLHELHKEQIAALKRRHEEEMETLKASIDQRKSSLTETLTRIQDCCDDISREHRFATSRATARLRRTRPYVPEEQINASFPATDQDTVLRRRFGIPEEVTDPEQILRRVFAPTIRIVEETTGVPVTMVQIANQN